MFIKLKGIARYVHLVAPSAPQGSDKKKYGLHLLIHKNDPQIPNINKTVQETIANSYPTGKPANFHDCWFDMAIKEPGNVALKDYMALKMGTLAEYGKPAIVDVNLQPVMDMDLDQNTTGKIVYVVVKFETYNTVQNGINCYVNMVMITDEKGTIPVDSLSSIPNPEEMFKNAMDFSGSAPSVPANTTVAPAPPPAPGAPTPPPAAPTHQMTAKAQGASYEACIAQGWTDETLIQHGMMLPPNGVTPSFIQ